MATKTIALLHPGEMGAAVGACLAGRDHRIVWASAGRSAETIARAQAAGLRDLQTLARCVRDAEIVFSVCPPSAALDLAREVAVAGFRGLYVDANAIAPDTTREVGRIVGAAGATFVDGGIVGPPPVPGVRSRLYLSGGPANDVAALFAQTSMEAVALDGPVGAASALKACYAAWTKGAQTLLAGVRALAQHEGVEAALLAEWATSQPGVEKRSESLLGNARKAWRWIGEMEEIALAMKSAGLPSGFHDASAEICKRLEAFKDRPKPSSFAEITAALGHPAR
jgi:3-hydroxyisobutyrate dehydrogenase-like beta-hydroxyacid dehydrogenase